MKKNYIKYFAIAFTAGAMILSSCSKEDSKDSSNNGGGSSETFSTTKKALFLYYTGSECNPCGSVGIPNYEAINADPSVKDKVISVAVHCNAPAPDSMYESGAGGELLSLIVANNSYSAPTFLIPPAAKFSGSGSTAKATALSSINTFSAAAPSVGLNVSASIVEGMWSVKTRMKFLSADSGQYKVAVLPIEDGVKYHQIVNGKMDNNFIHDQVLRGKFSGSAYGDEVKVGKVEAGTIIEKVSTGFPTINIPENSVKYWNKANMSAVVVVWKHTKNGTATVVEVLNCEKVKLPELK